MFDVPRRAVPPEEDHPLAFEPEMSMPSGPEVDLAALDREMAARLGRRRPHSE